MRILKINLNNLKESIDAIGEAVETIKNGGAIVYPTDTIYGLGVNALNGEAISRLFKIKRRPMEKAVPVIVNSIEMARKIAYIDYRKDEMLGKIWPSPITVILHKKDTVPDILTGTKDTIGIRIPESKLARILISSLGAPITATSANISGEEPNLDIQTIIDRFNQVSDKPDLILDAGILPPSEPSTILDLSGQKPKILRIGSVKKEQLLDILSF